MDHNDKGGKYSELKIAPLPFELEKTLISVDKKLNPDRHKEEIEKEIIANAIKIFSE